MFWEKSSNSLIPIVMSFITTSMFINLLFMFYNTSLNILLYVLIMNIIMTIIWMMSLFIEHLIGYQNALVVDCLKMGIMFFILSEITFFLSFFIGELYNNVSLDGLLGMEFSSSGTLFMESMSIPLLNTILLVSSSWSLSISHLYINTNQSVMMVFWLLVTIILGLWFLTCQFVEYKSMSFDISNSCNSSVFYISTGFHMMHVMIGLLCIISSSIVVIGSMIMNYDNVNYEFSSWYWHFVDVIWLLLFTLFYIYPTL